MTDVFVTRLNSPPLMVRFPWPRAAVLLSVAVFKVPLLITTPPVKVLAPERVQVPLPLLVIASEPEPSPITLEIVFAPVLEPVRVRVLAPAVEAMMPPVL